MDTWNWLYLAYHRGDIGDSGKEEPNKTLEKVKFMSIWEIPRPARNNDSPTCLHMRCPRPNTPAWWKPRRSKPTSIMNSKRMSVIKVVIVLSLVLRILTVQLGSAGTHEERT